MEYHYQSFNYDTAPILLDIVLAKTIFYNYILSYMIDNCFYMVKNIVKIFINSIRRI